MKVKYLHTMVRVNDIEKSKAFYCDLLGLEEIRRSDYEEGKFTLVFLSAPNQSECALELTHNWDGNEKYSEGRNFGHLAYEVENIYDICSKIRASGVEINRPSCGDGMRCVGRIQEIDGVGKCRRYGNC